MNRIFLDTDVLLDFFFGREPFAGDTEKLLHFCAERKISGFTSPLVITNIYYLLRKTASHHSVVDKLKKLLQIIDILDVNKKAIIYALNSEFKDFEDAVQHFSALHYGDIDVIVTRNVKDYNKSELAVFLPAEYLKILDFKN